MAGRPPKSINTKTGSMTKEEIHARTEIETKLKGDDNNVKPFDYLSKDQKRIFRYLIKEMEASGIIGNLDVYVLNNAAIAIDRLNKLEAQANEDASVMFDDKFLKCRKEYTNTFNKSCAELCLSPTSRAKIGSLNFQKKQNDDDPLLKALQALKVGDK